MSSTSATPKSKILNVVLPIADHARLVELANDEQRTKSKTASILIAEALNARNSACHQHKQAAGE